MRYLVCYRFNYKGRWYIYKDCKEDELQSTIENALLVEDVVEVKVSRMDNLKGWYES